LSETPLDKLEEALKPMLDIDGVLWFLALDNALINNDGYWVRASDYSLYRDPKGKFHVIPHDTNETFQAAMFMGFGAKGFKGPKGGLGEAPKGGKADNPGQKGIAPKGDGPKGGPFGGLFGPGGMGKLGAELDPLIGMDDVRKPLRSRLLSVPSLRARYLQHVRTIAETQLDWNKLGPRVVQYRRLIEDEVAMDTRKLYTLDAFKNDVADSATPAAMGVGGPNIGLRAFADQRRTFLINHPEVKKAGGQ